MSTSIFLEVVPEIDANPEHERLNFYTRALLLLRSPPCWNKHGVTRTPRHVTTLYTRHALHFYHRVVDVRDAVYRRYTQTFS